MGLAILLQVLYQSINTSYNIGVRQEDHPTTVKDSMRAFIGSSLVSAAIVMFTRIYFAPRLRILPTMIMANAIQSCFAAALGNVVNVPILRHWELDLGIEVRNQKGDVLYGKSKAAARKAILLTCLNRFIQPFTFLCFPALATFTLERLGLWPSGLVARLLELGLMIVSLRTGMSMS